MTIDASIKDFLTLQAGSEPGLEELYHENTKNQPSANPLSDSNDPNIAMNLHLQQLAIAETESFIANGFKRYSTAPQKLFQENLALPYVPLADVLERRHSASVPFVVKPVEWDKLGLLLKYSVGWNDSRTITTEAGELHYRYTPSAGRLYPLECYVMTSDEPDAPVKLWHYQPGARALELIDHKRPGEIPPAFGNLPDPIPPVILILTGLSSRLTWKYGPRGYRYLLIEAGHIGQNLCLVAESLCLGVRPVANYFDDVLHDLLDVDGINEVAVYTFFVGYEKTD
ncbi:MAG: SagB/ThcOx family dehydrogenase [Xanthomonadaceae bacterium]|nr:SagB/ThcOx family dehydrogenase [Xanthomonadaceae bacterium]